MRKLLASTTLIASAFALAMPCVAAADDDRDSADGFALALYGDAPYGCKAPTAAHNPDECPAGFAPDSPNGPNPGDTRQIAATPAFIDAVNRDPKVRLVMHVGDIHSGSTYCTQAYDQAVYDLWTQFKDPLVYTPGDNEWTDCQKSKEGGGVKNSAGQYVDYAAGHPVANLALVRSMFFPEAGVTLGRRKHVSSQAQAYDPAFPGDAEYVENVMWMQGGVVFVTINVPGGSNNDDDQWNTGAFGTVRSAPQIQEVAQRNAANLRWLEAAFAQAKAFGARGVVIGEQADMWDLDGTGPSLAHVANYEVFIAKIAGLTRDFARPVLLVNGDSHSFRSDNPLAKGAPCTVETGDGTAATMACSDDNYDSHPYYADGVPNFHRLVVHGSTFPLQYTRLTISPRGDFAASETSFGPFRWERVIP